MLQISHKNRFVAIRDFGDSAITSASGSGVPGKFLFLFSGFALGLGLMFEFASWTKDPIVEGIERLFCDIIPMIELNQRAIVAVKEEA